MIVAPCVRACTATTIATTGTPTGTWPTATTIATTGAAAGPEVITGTTGIAATGTIVANGA